VNKKSYTNYWWVAFFLKCHYAFLEYSKKGVFISVCKNRSEEPVDAKFRTLPIDSWVADGRCTVTWGREVLVGVGLNIRRPIWQLGSPFNLSEMKMPERSYFTPYKLHRIPDLN